MTIEVLNTGCDVGAEIAGADLTKPLASHDVARIEQAFLDHQVLLFRGQELSAQGFVDFSAQFGPLRRHIQKAFRHPTVPEIVYNRNVDDDGNFDEAGARRGVTNTLAEGWHSDGSYDESPPKVTTVHALELPSSGGNTCFASTYRAFETLPPAFRDRVMNMKAEFALGRNKRNQQTQILTRKLTAEDKEQPTVIHPVVRIHPEDTIELF